MRAWLVGGWLLGACAGAAAEPPSAGSSEARVRTTHPNDLPPSAESASVPSGAPTPVPTGGSVLLGDVAAPKGFDPTPTLVAAQQKLVACYNQARASNPALHGKLKLRIEVNELGAVLNVSAEPGGSANDPTLVACAGEGLKTVTFPRPPGTATLIVPMVFRP
ncbi:MAG TPA: AgmX/PglI C-terminal domain-containing protein [Polyangiaceae bacterium]|nr:AgmX/PglI C-terminal domain-containing protein [Polyangiaceae bacterium]